jgi:hypothetical protein
LTLLGERRPEGGSIGSLDIRRHTGEWAGIEGSAGIEDSGFEDFIYTDSFND